jgi:hypothetical protein
MLARHRYTCSHKMTMPEGPHKLLYGLLLLPYGACTALASPSTTYLQSKLGALLPLQYKEGKAVL